MGNPISSLVSTGVSLATGSNLGGFLAGQAIDSAMSGGGGGSSTTYAQPNVQYGTGANTYTVGGKPVDTSKYFITGDKGVYNLLPMLNGAYQDKNKLDSNLGGYNAYNSINQKLADDAKAQQAFQQAFQIQTLNPANYNPSTLPNYLKTDFKHNIYNPNADKNSNKLKSQPSFPSYQYVDFGFGKGDNLSQISKYAANQNNPFFLAYTPTAPEVAPVNTGLLSSNTTTQSIK